MRISLLSLALALTACAPADSEVQAMDHDELAAKGAAKVDVCHLTGSGAINILNVSSSAVSAHLAHGDHLAGTYFLDADGDGEGDASMTSDCLDAGYVENSDDCDDSDASISTFAEEICDDGVDNNCDGEIDEECSVELTIHVAGDNAVWGWVDGTALVFDNTFPDWGLERTATIEVDSGMDHVVSFYVEDWGGLAYFAASVQVDGVVEVVSGDGDFRSNGSYLSFFNQYITRIPYWSNTPSSAADSPNLLFNPGSTWGDWMQAGYDDSSWDADSVTCATPSYWNISDLNTTYGTFGNLYADGAESVWHKFGYSPASTCYSTGRTAVAYRTEFSL